MQIEICAHDHGTADLAVQRILQAAQRTGGKVGLLDLGRRQAGSEVRHFRTLNVETTEKTMLAFTATNLPLGARAMIKA